MTDAWWECAELTLQGNLTINGFSARTWSALRNSCRIRISASTGMACIDWNDSSVLVSPSVIQHASLKERFVEPSVIAPAPPETPPTRTDELLAALEPESAQGSETEPSARRRRRHKAD